MNGVVLNLLQIGRICTDKIQSLNLPRKRAYVKHRYGHKTKQMSYKTVYTRGNSGAETVATPAINAAMTAAEARRRLFARLETDFDVV